MPRKRASQPHENPSQHKKFSGWKWFVPPVLAVLTAVTVWWGMPKPAIPSIYENAKPLPIQPSTPTANRSVIPNAIGSTIPPSAGHTLSSSSTPAQTGSGSKAKTMVALGDSITFGYNLPGASTNHPSPDAYPYLVGQHEQYKVIDLGVPGFTSQDLLTALQTPAYQSALRKANVVTVDIGSNDLLSTSYSLLAALQTGLPAKDNVLSDTRYQQALQQYADNLPKILAAIHQQTNAPIVLMNLYDPFPDGSSIHNVGEQLIAAANQIVLQTAAASGIPLVDAYAAINHHQDTLVRLESLDIHPTVAGQQALAKDVEQVLDHPLQAQPSFFAIAKQGILVRSKPELGPNAIHWLESGLGLLVTGKNGNWLQVTTPSGQTGFIQAKYATLVARPTSDVSFQSHSEHLPTGTIIDATSRRSADVFIWNGTVYAPVQYLAGLAQATTHLDTDTDQLDVETPNHSGLIQTGWLGSGTPSANGTPSLSPLVSVKLSTFHAYAYVQFSTSGLMVTIDGEPVNLQGQVVLHEGQVAVPVEAFWQALGGTVTRDASGLPKLSVSGS